MKIQSVPAAARDAVQARPDRPATALLADMPDARLVVFRIAPGQAVAPHTSTSTVLLQVVSGSGFVSGESEERGVREGDLVVYEPSELHGMRAEDEELVLAAVITPRPGGR